MRKKLKDAFCSFCGRAHSETKRLIPGKNNAPVFDTSLFYPADNDTVSGDSIALRWSASDLDSGQALYYKVYFHTANPPGEYDGNYVTDTTFKVIHKASWGGTWVSGIDYYWQIEAFDGIDSTMSPVRSFQH